MKKILVVLTLLVLVSGCTQERYGIEENESGNVETTSTTHPDGQASTLPKETKSTTSSIISTTLEESMLEESTRTTSTTIPETGVEEDGTALYSKVACVPVNISLDGLELSIQSGSEKVPVGKTKVLTDYEKAPEKLSDDVYVNRPDMFVYRTKTCCEGESSFDTYVYYVLSIAPGKDWLTFMPVPIESTYYDYSAIEDRYESYFFRDIPSRDLAGTVVIWNECGNDLVLSFGEESRKRGDSFRSESLVERLLSRSVVGVSTTSTTTSTTTTFGSTVVSSCDELAPGQLRDACYLNMAMSSGDVEMCDLIESDNAKEICLENTMVETDGTSTTIEGYVVNDSTGAGFKGLKVRAVSKSSGETEASDTTDSRGFYSMDVPSRDTYQITVTYEGKEFVQEIYAKKDYTHEIWFRLG